MVKGQCIPCRIIYVWHSKLRLKDAACGECRRPLVRVTPRSPGGNRIINHHPAAGSKGDMWTL
mgnify:FL=1